ncbi:hypothetical protein [Jeotgalibacillus campisalis]|uniref:Uncharacterized protein n=1 Tax=Jeotgalibacillus campisalis TaxID=220754 RepID=A0A0C2SA59_9BACL|nr:hypothetical protein [Jeotgalibacillus campisalis]KIL50859.1 hypothetical protein KR50_07400 [Jeotgalibacillus campisalis]
MRLLSLLELLILAVMFGWFFYVLDPLMEDRWTAYLAFIGIATVITILFYKLEGKIPILEKRLDQKISLLLIFSIVMIPILLAW